jgi:cobalt-zinc-cadmium efflux system outer membrane protein
MRIEEARRRLRRCILAVVPIGAVALGACEHVPPAPIDASLNAQRLVLRSLDNPAVVAELGRHGEELADASAWTLDQLTIAAWMLRTDIAVARAELEAATAGVRVDSLRPSPQVATTFERVTNADAGVEPWVLGASVALMIETGGKRDIRRQRALARVEALQWQLAQTLWDARAELNAALLDRMFAERTLALDGAEIDLRREFLGWIDTRLALGAARSEERLVATEALSQIERQLGQDRAGLETASARLAAAIGITPGALRDTVLVEPDIADVPELSEQDLVAARALALTHRLDVRRALAEYEVAEQDLRAAVAAQYPDVTLGPGLLRDQSDRKITFDLNLPALLSGRTGAVIDRAIAARAVVAARFDEVQSNALADIETSFAQYRTMLGVLSAAERAEREAEQARATVQRRLDAGAADRGELIAAEINVLSRERNTLEIRAELSRAISALQNGIQQPIYPPSLLALPVQAEAQP